MAGDIDQAVRKPEACDRVSIDWVERPELEVDTGKPTVTLFTLRRSNMSSLCLMLTATLGDEDSFIRFNKDATSWLGAWMDSHTMFNELHSRRMKTVRAAEARLRSHPVMHGVVPICVKAV
jgi:hypothetical protein